MKDDLLDVIVVGAGFGGLTASYHLKKYGLSHVVFERGRTGESWRSQRWDSFKLNSTNKLNEFEGVNYDAIDPDAFCSAPEFVTSMAEYVKNFQLPVSENSKVISVEKPGGFFQVTVSVNNTIKNYLCRQLLIASGSSNEIKVPSFSENISKSIKQFHASEYKNSAQLPAGAVLVVGSAQSGIQIAEDLVAAGRKVFLSTSCVARIPRWYRGRDIFYWLKDIKFFDTKAEEITDPKMLQMRPPQITGTGSGRDTVSLQALAKKGAVILGKMENADDQNVFFQSNAAMHVKFADGFSKNIKAMIDEYIMKNQIAAPPPHHDEADTPDADAVCASSITSLDVRENNISSVIWCTGFNMDYSYIKLPVFDNDGHLKHKDGIPVFPGLYFLGYPWLLSRKSVILFGLKDDAKFVTDKIYNHFKENAQATAIAE